MTLFERVSELAKKQHIGLKELATRLGLSESAIYQWRTSSPKSETLGKVADYFGVTTDYLLGREEKPMQSDDKKSNSQIEFRLEKDGLEDSDISDYVEDVQAYAEYRRKKLMEKKKK